MRKLNYYLSLSLALLLIAGCTKQEIQPEPLNSADDVSLKSAQTFQEKNKGDHRVPFKAKFKLTATVNHYGPVSPLDDQTAWVLPIPTGGMHVDIVGSGNATHLGKTDFVIQQWWTRAYPHLTGITPGDSYGQGDITFTAANGDLLFASYYGSADHQDDPPTEILTHGVFKKGTGRFENAEGNFEWDGLFVKTHPISQPPAGEDLGYGEVVVTGTIVY